MRDNIRTPLNKLIEDYMNHAGTGVSESVRDLMTELRHYCDSARINADERWQAASEVYDEELSSCLECGENKELVMVPDAVGKGMHEEWQCSNPECPSHG